MDKTAIVTGAGSGVGRASLELGRQGWNVALVGRRLEPLEETAKLAPDPTRMFPVACDVADWPEVQKMALAVEKRFGPVQVLVAAAGTNIPKRSLEVLSPGDFDAVVAANLGGTFHCAQAVLPGMRKQGAGSIVAIVSDAGLAASPKAGAAYVASKFGQRGLIQTINAEERSHGIRATAIHPGDINTAILDKRPTPPPPEARAGMLQPEDIAACVMLAINLPPRAIIEELVIRPR